MATDVKEFLKSQEDPLISLLETYSKRIDQLEKRIEILENNQKIFRSKTLSRG